MINRLDIGMGIILGIFIGWVISWVKYRKILRKGVNLVILDNIIRFIEESKKEITPS